VTDFHDANFRQLTNDQIMQINGWTCPHCKIWFPLGEMPGHVDSEHANLIYFKMELIVVEALLAKQSAIRKDTHETST